MDSQLKHGLIEACVLAVVRRQESYGYEIVKRLPESLGMTESTLYPVLRRLASDGLVSQRSAQHNGRLRRYYSITPSGVERIARFLESRSQVRAVYDFVQAGGALAGMQDESGADGELQASVAAVEHRREQAAGSDDARTPYSLDKR